MPTVTEQLDYIVESGMKFGPFHKDEVFRLETDATYQKSFRDYGIKTCEFVLKRNGKLYFIEAKTSCPNYETAATTEEKRKKYEEYIHDIAQKMRDSLNMYLSFLLNKNQVSDFPAEMKDFDWGNLQIRFVLVVKDAESEWLAPYDPAIGRFINADSYASTGQDFLGYNMFAYCGNNPIVRKDASGGFWNAIIGAIVGAVVGTVSALVTGGDFVDVLISAAGGAISGAIIATTGNAALASAVNGAASYIDARRNGASVEEAVVCCGVTTVMSYATASVFPSTDSPLTNIAVDTTLGLGSNLVSTVTTTSIVTIGNMHRENNRLKEQQAVAAKLAEEHAQYVFYRNAVISAIRSKIRARNSTILGLSE